MVGGELIDCMSGEMREVGAEPMDRSAKRVACDVESNGDDGNDLGDGPQLLAYGLIAGDLEVHDGGGGVCRANRRSRLSQAVLISLFQFVV